MKDVRIEKDNGVWNRSRSANRTGAHRFCGLERLNNLSESKGLPMEQMVRGCIRDLIAQPDELFRITAKRVIEKNAELYRRLS
jgi:hypothetical protein